MTIVDRINSNVGYDDNGNVNNLSKTNNGATFVGGVFMTGIFFIVQVINGSSLIIIIRVSIKSNAIIVAIVYI